MKKKRLQRSDMLWLLAVAVLVLLQFWWLPGNPGTPEDTYSNAVSGKRGFYQTLENLSQAGLLPVVRRESEKLIPDSPCTLVIASPDRYPNDHEERALVAFVLQGGSLVFAPNWLEPDCEISDLQIETQSAAYSFETSPGTSEASSAPGSAPASTDTDASSDSTSLTAEAEDVDQTPGSTETANMQDRTQTGTVPAADSGETESSEGGILDDAIARQPSLAPQQTEFETERQEIEVSQLSVESKLVSGPLLWRTRAGVHGLNGSEDILVKSAAEGVQVAAWPRGRGLVLLSASGDVFSNRAMLDAGSAELAVRLVEYAHTHGRGNETSRQAGGGHSRPIVVSEFLNASDKYRGTAVLMSPGLRSGTLQLLVIAFLAGWFGFHRFGPAKKTRTHQRRSLTESATAVGNLHFRTDSGREAVAEYLEYMKTQLSRVFGSSIQLDDTVAVAARTGLAPSDVEQTVTHAFELAQSDNTTSQAAAAIIRELSRIRKSIGGVRKQTS